VKNDSRSTRYRFPFTAYRFPLSTFRSPSAALFRHDGEGVGQFLGGVAERVFGGDEAPGDRGLARVWGG